MALEMLCTVEVCVLLAWVEEKISVSDYGTSSAVGSLKAVR